MRQWQSWILVALVVFSGIVERSSQAQPAEYLLLITYDGLRWQELFGGADERLLAPEARATRNAEAIKEKYWADTPEERRERLLPFFWNVIAKEGQIYGHEPSGSPSVVTNGRNFSYPGYSEILTGAADESIDSNAKRNNPNVTVLEWLNQRPGFEGRVAAFGSWDVFPYIINAERSGVPVNAGWDGESPTLTSERMTIINTIARETPRYWAGVRFDVFTFHPAVEYIKVHRPKVLYIAFGETDDWAHDGRYDMYLESARRTDEYIERLWNLVQSIPEYAGKTALLMTTDHGRGDTVEDWTGHGSRVEGCENIWIAALGAGVAPKGLVRDTPTTQSQVAATAATMLGLDFRSDHPDAAPPIDY